MKEKKLLNIKIGQNIKKIREDAGLTQEAFSELVGLGEKHISAIECGAVGLSLPALNHICLQLSVSADAILFGSSDNQEQDEKERAVQTLSDRLLRLPDKQFWAVKGLIDQLLTVIATGQ